MGGESDAQPHHDCGGGQCTDPDIGHGVECDGCRDRDHAAIAIECAAKYRNVALSDRAVAYGAGYADVMIEVSGQFLPDLLDGVRVSGVRLVPQGDELTFVFDRCTQCAAEHATH